MKSNIITFDTFEIDSDIKKKKESTVDNSLFLLYNPNNISEFSIQQTDQGAKYLVDIKTELFSYKGIISADLTREIFGVNVYSRNDKYIGSWLKDKKHGVGVYDFFIENGKKQQYYFGQWEQGVKKGKGIYLWKHSDSSVTDLSTCSYDAFFGSFENDTFVEGYSIKKSITAENQIDYVVYSGAMNSDGKKNDSKGILIENDNCFIGEFADDQMVNGTVIILEPPLDSQSEVNVKTSYNFEKKEGDIYDFNSINETSSEDIQPVLNLKKKIKENNLFNFLEDLYKDYLAFESNLSDLVIFQTPSSKSFLDQLESHLTDDSKFLL